MSSPEGDAVPRATDVSSKGRSDVQRITLAVTLLVGMLVAARLASLLRPLADDYCQASRIARLGLDGYVSDVWSSWSGDIVTVTLVGMLVGVPLAVLPFGIASSVSVIFVALLFSVGVRILLRREVKVRTSLVGGLGLLFAFICGWAVNYSMLKTLGLRGPIRPGFSSALATWSWGTVIVVYVVPYIILTISLVLLKRAQHDTLTVARGCLALAFGLLACVGLSGASVSLTAFVALITMSLAEFFWRPETWRRWALRALTGGFIIAIGAWISFLSPGVQNRRSVLTAVPMDSFEGLGSWVSWLGDSLVEFVLIMTVNPAGWMLGVSAAVVAGSRSLGSRGLAHTEVSGYSRVEVLWTLTIIFGAHALIVAVSEAFTYRAWWHYVPLESASLVWWIVAGALCGSRSLELGRPLLNAPVLVGPILFLGFGLGLFWQNAEARFSLWNSSAAPLDGVADIQDGWVEECWNVLGQFRQLPERAASDP